jgi:hypothetical protein
LLRYVHSGIFVDEWEGQYDGAGKHTTFYLHSLGEYVEHFSGRPVTYVAMSGPPSATGPDALEVLGRALGLTDAGGEGEKVGLVIPGLDPIEAVVDYRSSHFIGLRGRDALYRFYCRNAFGGQVDQLTISSPRVSMPMGARRRGRPGWTRSSPDDEDHQRSARWGQPVTRDQVWQPLWLAELQAVARGHSGHLPVLGRPSQEQIRQLPEEFLEAGRTDDLDHPGGDSSGVPHCVHLVAGLGDVSARSQDYFPGAGPEADLSLRHDRVLVFARMKMGRHQSPDREGMLDHGNDAARVLPPQLEVHADGSEVSS